MINVKGRVRGANRVNTRRLGRRDAVRIGRTRLIIKALQFGLISTIGYST